MCSTTITKPVLGYWNIRGLGQPIRALLEYLQIDYENKLYKFDLNNPPRYFSQEWLNDKANLGLDFPNIPYWIDGDLKLTQSCTILRHIARQNDPSLIPDGPQIEMIENFIMDVWNALAIFVYAYTKEGESKFESEQKILLEQLSKYLGDKKWIMGDKITYVDFLLYETIFCQNKYKPETLNPFPNLVQLNKNFEEIPTIAKFIASPEYIKTPCVGVSAELKGF